MEHINCDFKAGLMQLCGNYSEESLQRIAKSLLITSCLQEKLAPHYVDRQEKKYFHFFFILIFSSGF